MTPKTINATRRAGDLLLEVLAATPRSDQHYSTLLEIMERIQRITDPTPAPTLHDLINLNNNKPN